MPLPVEPLDAAVWAEVCRLLENPAQIAEEYHRRLQAVRSGPDRPELETIERQLSKLRTGTGRLIDTALFEAAQEQLGENRRRRRQRKAGARYLLQGLLVCQSCGYALCDRWKASL